MQAKRNLSLKTLRILDRELMRQPFLGGDIYTIADISVFAYVHLAGDALLPLDDFANVTAWVDRVMQQERFLEKIYRYYIDPHSAGELQ